MNKTPRRNPVDTNPRHPKALGIEVSTANLATLVFTVRHPDHVTACVAAHALAAALTPAALEKVGRTSRAAAPYVETGRGGEPTVRLECNTELEVTELRQRYGKDKILERVLVVLGALLPAAKS